MKKLFLLLFIVGLSFVLLSRDKRSIVAVMEFADSTGTLSEEILLNASQYMRSSFVGSNQYVVISRERQQNEMVKVMRKESHQMCRAKDCQIPLGQSLSADTILVSTISRFGGKYTLTVELIDLAKEATVKGATADFDGKEEGLRNAVDDVVAQVFGARRARPAPAFQPDPASQQTPSAPVVPSGVSAQDEQSCNFARRKNTVEMWSRYLREFPEGACYFEANIFFEREKERRRREEDRRRAEEMRQRRVEETRKRKFPHSHAGLNWSDPSTIGVNHHAATEACRELGGRPPTISELRTLIRNCPSTQTGGACKVTDSCLSRYDCRSACDGCSSDSSGKYSVFGDTGVFWSSSSVRGFPPWVVNSWVVNFRYGGVSSSLYRSSEYLVRCVGVE